MEDKTKKKISKTKKEVKTKTKEEPKIKETKKDVKKNLEFNLVEVIIIILVTTALVSIASGIIIFKNYDKLYALKPIVENRSSNEIIENYNRILDNYVDEVDKNGLIDAAIKGMYDYLEDEFSIYVDKEANNTLQEQLHGRYSGIGIEITINDKNEIIINRVFSDSPAEKAGLKKDDILVELDGNSLEGKDSAYFADNVKNSKKESFNIVYKRNSKNYKVTIKRELVTIDSITTTQYDNVGYIKLDTFSLLTDEQLKKGLDSIKESTKSLILDLRDNTGGYLNAAFDAADLFLEKKQVAYQIKDKEGHTKSYKAKSGPYRKFDKIVVLINESSASASEILTLALKENLNATIVGKKSYGKGTVQETKQLSSGAMVKYTVSYWLSPKGNSINKIGIIPDIEVEGKDKQLEKAIEVAK